VIGETERGMQGFGYDPLFLLPELGKTLAELPLEVKNRVSHRGRALAALKEALGDFL
jgi:XTP/dITP diphosphohydrolase